MNHNPVRGDGILAAIGEHPSDQFPIDSADDRIRDATSLGFGLLVREDFGVVGQVAQDASRRAVC